jgi:hypothetical protein
MSATIVSSTQVADSSSLFSAAGTFALDLVIQAEATLASGANLLNAMDVVLLLSSDGINYVPVASKSFPIASGTTFQIFNLSDYIMPVSPTRWYVNNILTVANAPLRTFNPPWTNYQLLFIGNMGAAVTVQAVGDSGMISVPTVTPSGLLDSFGTSQGSILYRDTAVWEALGPGTAGQVLTTGGAGADPSWTNASGGGSGTVTSVTFTGDGTVLSSTPDSPVTTTGTLAATLNTQSANLVLAGPTSGAPAAPTFRALVAGDVPSTSGAAVNVFLNSGSPYTFAKPAGTFVRFIGIAPGGGGGGGGVAAASTAIYGGGGGTGGTRFDATYRIADLTWPITITIGTGGAGGAGHASGTAGTGTSGTGGAALTIGAYINAAGGNSGGGGSTTSGPSGGPSNGQILGGSGTASSITAAASNANSVAGGTSGAGGGGGISAANTAYNGGAGGAAYDAGGTAAGGNAGNAGGTPNAGNGTFSSVITDCVSVGSGGGGGGASLTVGGGNGGTGGAYGGGGGGGGAAQTGNGAGGTGGTGGAGICIALSW